MKLSDPLDICHAVNKCNSVPKRPHAESANKLTMKSKGKQNETRKDEQCSNQKPTKIDELKKYFQMSQMK